MAVLEREVSFARHPLAKLQGAIAYEPKFDQKEGIKTTYLSKQIDTFLGERLNVLLSKSKYEIRDDLMYGEDLDDPFSEVIRRGIEYRRKLGGDKRVDKKREEAELAGFLKIEEAMSSPNTQVGTMMLSISPIGIRDSLYQHNFYDVFTLRETYGRRFVEARRYSSALTFDEYKDKLSPLSFMGDIKNDADFLSDPIKIDPSTSLRVFFENAGEVHSYLHKDHKTTELKEFERIINNCAHLKQEYIRTRDPGILDAIMNKADEAAGLVEFKRSTKLKVIDEVDFYGKQQVRAVAAGCGPSKSTSPFSVSDFGFGDKDDLGSREFPCPECKQKNRRPYNEKITNCQHCGSNKVAC